jgi:carbon storage regulator
MHIPTIHPGIHQGRGSMLVLSRKQNERIRVGESVVVTVVRVSGDKVRIGIEAPPHVRVLRDELEEETLDEKAFGCVVLEGATELPIPRLLGFAS